MQNLKFEFLEDFLDADRVKEYTNMGDFPLARLMDLLWESFVDRGIHQDYISI